MHRVRYKGESLHRAATGTVRDLFKLGGSGGVIALDSKGNGEHENFCSTHPLGIDPFVLT
jgi:isoaspartyl peptidase/L-asparaginase-like protein (Ntn-hydrolase superfamily)